MTELFAKVSSNGDIIESKVFAVQNVETFEVEIKPNFKMGSVVKIVIYYITDGGEIISDSLSLDYEPEFENKVSCIIFGNELNTFFLSCLDKKCHFGTFNFSRLNLQHQQL